MTTETIQFMSPEEYLQFKYQESNIDPTLIWSKSNLEKYSMGELWWNGVSSQTPHPCRICQDDNRRFKGRLNQKQDVSKFDAYVYETHESGSEIKLKANDRRQCDPVCFWFDYFYARRKQLLSPKMV